MISHPMPTIITTTTTSQHHLHSQIILYREWQLQQRNARQDYHHPVASQPHPLIPARTLLNDNTLSRVDSNQFKSNRTPPLLESKHLQMATMTVPADYAHSLVMAAALLLLLLLLVVYIFFFIFIHGAPNKGTAQDKWIRCVCVWSQSVSQFFTCYSRTSYMCIVSHIHWYMMTHWGVNNLSSAHVNCIKQPSSFRSEWRHLEDSSNLG